MQTWIISSLGVVFLRKNWGEKLNFQNLNKTIEWGVQIEVILLAEHEYEVGFFI